MPQERQFVIRLKIQWFTGLEIRFFYFQVVLFWEAVNVWQMNYRNIPDKFFPGFMHNLRSVKLTRFLPGLFQTDRYHPSQYFRIDPVEVNLEIT